MASGGSERGDVFDVRKVRRFVELMNEHDLSEIDLRQSDQRIRLRRGQEPVVSAQTVAPAAVPVAAAPAAAAPTGGAAEASAAEDSTAIYVTSPMVGTFYTSSSPDSPPLVKVGDHVGAETVVCIIEAMKVFNEIPAECSGSVTAVLIENGDAVEYGQKLFKLEPSS